MCKKAIHLWLNNTNSGSLRETTYRVAGYDIHSDVPLPALTPFLLDSHEQFQTPAPVAMPSLHQHGGATIYDDMAFLGREQRHVHVRRDNVGFWIDVASVGLFFVEASGKQVVCCRRYAKAEDAVWPLALLGPVLTLALALSGVWCLHGSAVRYKGKAIVFAGESGRGKSTLAAFLNASWPRLADDFAPISAEGNLLPHFPQLKLTSAEQITAQTLASLPVAAIYVLRSGNEVALQPVPLAEAALTLARHTVAARLFDQSLLRQHLAWCSAMAHAIPVVALTYPHRRDALPCVQAALAVAAGQVT
ncbi:MAG: hypothetical protein M9928_20460 [Anaerolineae bacterium]|nr:hypothetical protein [Anaerolineae bacterium]